MRRRTVLWSGFRDGGRCGARRSFAAVPRATWIRPRSNRKMLETPPLSTAAKPTFDPVARSGVPPGAKALEATTIAATAAIARTAATPATARRSTRRGRIAGVRPESPSTFSWTAGAWSALWTAAECSPQKSSALGGGASRLRGASRLGGSAPRLRGGASGLGGCASGLGGASGLAGGASPWRGAARGPNGTSSSRGPSQSRGRRTTLPRA